MGTNSNCCRVCGSEAKPLWAGTLLDIRVDYFECGACGYVQTEEPYWLERAYSKAINDSDTGIMVRNTANARIVLGSLVALRKLHGTVVDCAGGYGILVRLLRDYGVNALWSDRYCENLVARGFGYAGESADLVTAFEAFEHFVDPPAEFSKLLTISDNVLLSTQLIPRPTPRQGDWWYYGREHGQHIGFFRIETLGALAAAHNKYLTTDDRGYHLFSRHPVNRMAWRLLMRANALVPMLARPLLRPLTWPDHLTIATKERR